MGSPSRIRIGISACLLGQQVRYDGGHKRDAFLTDVLGSYVEWVSVCPEVEVGLGTPRETLHLVRSGHGIRMVTSGTRIDHTDAMERWARLRLEALAAGDLSGYVLKANSPSCGMDDVKVFGPDGVPEPDGGTGLFARALLEYFPSLPVAEEGHLTDPEVREHFIGRVFAYRRLQDLFDSGWTPADLGRFHSAHEMLLLAHSPPGYRELGGLVASAGGRPRNELRALYESGFMRALAARPSRGTHTDALMHMAGELGDVLDADAKRELLKSIDEYRRGAATLEKPLRLIRQHAMGHDIGYLRAQVYLEPDPAERMVLRSMSEQHDPRSSTQIRAQEHVPETRFAIIRADPRPAMSDSRSAQYRPVLMRRIGRLPEGPAEDAAAVEEPLEIRLHGTPFAVIMRTPGEDRALAAGFLLAEGIVRSSDDIGAIEHCRHPDRPDAHNVVDVYLIGAAAESLDRVLAERRQVVANSSCGVCGRLTIESLRTRANPLHTRTLFDRAIVGGLPDRLRERQRVFDGTGGLHGAGLFAPDGTCERAAEDVGRHNAVDKVIGASLLDERLPLSGRALAVSGRTSFEIVQKAWLAGVELICAVSAPSTLAIDLAEDAGITLLGFARDGGFNVYTHHERIGVRGP